MDLREFEVALNAPPQMSEEERALAMQAMVASNGNEKQHVIVMEELAELAQQISKRLRGKGNQLALLEEMADVAICLEMLCYIDNISKQELDDAIAVKLRRGVDGIEKNPKICVLDQNSANNKLTFS